LPFPAVWDPTAAFGVKNFAGQYEAPILALGATLQHLGVPWGVWEKVLFFWPLAVLSFILPWLFARQLLGRSPWALFSPLIFAGNTYFLIIESGHITVAVAETLAFAVLLAFIRSINSGSVSWSLAAGLLFGLQAAYEIRIAYLTLLVALFYLVLKLVADVHGKIGKRRIGLTMLTILTFAGTQAYWWLPFLTYEGERGIPIAATPWLAFMQLSHGITGVHPFWTGAVPTDFRTTDVNPAYFLVPLVAFGAIFARRIRTEVLWLGLVALVAAFLIKQQNPPGGQLYDWMFRYLPGWSVFREASKLFFIVALAFCVLVPFALRAFLNSRVGLTAIRNMAVGAALIALIGLQGASFGPLLRGQLGGTTHETDVPPSFSALAKMLQSDPRYSPVLWVGGPSVNDGVVHRFPIASQQHPLVILKGTADAGDVLANFCLTDSVAFCYLDEELFPFLLARIHAGYVVAPIRNSVGELPIGTSRDWIKSKLAAILGLPLVSSDGTLALWRLEADGASIAQARAIALVDASSGTTIAALPALEALDVPTVYQWNLSRAPQSANVPSSIRVLPRLSGGCRSPNGGTFSVLARSVSPSLDVSLQGEMVRLPLLATPRAPANWGVYGPLALKAGFNSLDPALGSALGPCMEWSPLVATLLSSPSNGVVTSVLTPERVSATVQELTGPWIELMRGFDSGWTLSTAREHILGDGLFNLYYMGTDNDRQPASRQVLTFSFSSHPSEFGGAVISLVTVAAALFLIWISARTGEKSGNLGIGIKQSRLSTVSRQLGVAGLVLLTIAAVVHAITWSGGSLRRAASAVFADPYSAEQLYTVAAMAILGVSIFLRLLSIHRQADTGGERNVP
jgi:hypothetical protein